MRSRRVRTVLQAEVGECGLACLAMIAAWHGREVGLGRLRRQLPGFARGGGLGELIDAASALGLSARALRVEPAELARLALPCIAHWDFRHFVVVERARRGRTTIHDPAHGRREVGAEEVATRFTGVALELTPSAAFVRMPRAPALRLRTLLGHVTGLRPLLVQLGTLAVGVDLLALLAPLLLQWVVDHAVASADRDLLTALVLGFLLLLVLQAALAFGRGALSLHLASQLGLRWLAALVHQLLRLPVAYFDCRTPADIASRVGSAQAVQRALTAGWVEAMTEGATALLVLVVMLAYAAPLAVVAMLASAGLALQRLALSRRLQQEHGSMLRNTAGQQGLLLELVTAIRGIRVAGDEARAAARWENEAAAAMDHAVAADRLGLRLRSTQALVQGGEQLVAVWLGAGLVIDGRMSVGMLLAYLAYRAMFVQRVAALVDRLGELGVVRAHAERLLDILDTPTVVSPPSPDASRGAPREPAAAKSWQCSRDPLAELVEVSLAAGPGRPQRLDRVSLGIAPGELVALIGPSGAGKTSLVEVLLGLVPPDSGRVIGAGADPARPLPAGAATAVAAVLQEDRVLACSVLANIAGFDPLPDFARVTEAARLAGIDASIRSLALGYDSVLSHGGAPLSGGERQRLLLARALYRRPGLLVLDEATSALDVPAEQALLDALRRAGLAVLLVTHRQESLVAVDRIVQMVSGCVVERPAAGRSRPFPTAFAGRPADRSACGTCGPHGNGTDFGACAACANGATGVTCTTCANGAAATSTGFAGCQALRQ